MYTTQSHTTVPLNGKKLVKALNLNLFLGCSVLLNHRVHAVVGVLSDDADPMVTVMKLEKAPQETYADIGGLDQQIQVRTLVMLSTT